MKLISNYRSLNKSAIINFLFGLTVFLTIPSLLYAKSDNTSKSHSPISIFCQPVQGNQKFFGDKPVFNTFHGGPVPLIFFIKGNQAQLKNPALVLYLPPQVQLREAMQIGASKPDITYTFQHKKVSFHGKNYVRYQTTDINAKQISSSYKPRWRNFRIVVALDAPASFDSGKIYWAVQSGGQEYGLNHCTIRFLDPLPVPSAKASGEFSIMRYHNLEDSAFHSHKLQQAQADMMLASGIRGAGASYDKNSRRGKFDQYLQSRGFHLFIGGFFQGPMNVHHWHHKPIANVPIAMGPDGKRIKKNMTAPIPTLQSKTLSQLYDEYAQKRIKKSGADYVMFDYEPWQWPKKYGFGPATLKAFKKQFHITEPLTSKTIIDQYRKPWTLFWVGLSDQFTKMMAQACYQADPDIKTVSYTYFRNYEIPDVWTQFKGCPKDPRLEAQDVDELMLSSYNYNGRKLVDALRMSKKHIQGASISVIASLARRTKLSTAWVRKGADLSPQQLYQKAILCAAMGVKRFGLYPGGSIDGAFYKALGRASRLIWAHENFYYHGKNIRKQIGISVTKNNKPADNKDYAFTAQLLNGKILISLFNFTDKPLKFKIENNNKSAIVKAHGVKLMKFEQ